MKSGDLQEWSNLRGLEPRNKSAVLGAREQIFVATLLEEPLAVAYVLLHFALLSLLAPAHMLQLLVKKTREEGG